MKPKQNHSGNKAKSLPIDCCQTPAYAVRPLLPHLPLSAIWEPAAGEGYLAKALRDAGHEVVTSDVLDGQNFFHYEPPAWNCLVTNPPYSIKFDWLERCYSFGKPFALLVPVETMGAKAAQRLTERYGVELMFLDKRVNFKMPNSGWDSSAQFPVMWLYWKLLPAPIMYGHIEYQSSPNGEVQLSLIV